MQPDHQAVARLYHAWFTGLILATIARRGAASAAEMLFHVFRRQHHSTFLPGLKKLGLDGLPHAVAAARYHYLSNQIGGVRVEYMEESERKAWVRYAPPRWIWQGTAICAIPSEVSQAILRGWHGHNGVTLGNPRLGFVCTKQTTDGQDGLEGYYYEYDHPLEPEERVRFARGEEAPPFDPARAPVLPTTTWPQERLDKAARNYAMEYIRTTLPEMIDRFGPADARYLAGTAARQIGMHFFDECRTLMGAAEPGIAGFATFFQRMAAAQGDEPVVEPAADGSVVIRQRGWRLMRGLLPLHDVAFECWNELWAGCLAAHDRHSRWSVIGREDWGDPAFAWRVAPKQ